MSLTRPEWTEDSLVEFYLQCVTSYALRRVSEDASDRMQHLLDGMFVVPPTFKLLCLRALFGNSVDEHLATLNPDFAVYPKVDGCIMEDGIWPGDRRKRGDPRRPGGMRTTMPRFDIAASSVPRPSTVASWHGSESTAVEETEEERARRQAKNRKKKEQKKRKAAEKTGQEQS